MNHWKETAEILSRLAELRAAGPGWRRPRGAACRMPSSSRPSAEPSRGPGMAGPRRSPADGCGERRPAWPTAGAAPKRWWDPGPDRISELVLSAGHAAPALPIL